MTDPTPESEEVRRAKMRVGSLESEMRGRERAIRTAQSEHSNAVRRYENAKADLAALLAKERT